MDACWAAGHFEGEGTVTILKGGRESNFVPQVSLSSTDQQVIRFFCERWPATTMGYRILGGNTRPVYTWCVRSSVRVHRFLTDITPYLRTDRVKAKAALVFAFCSHMLAEQYNREGDKGWKVPYVERIRRLNEKGIPLLPSGERVIDRVRAMLPPPAEEKVVAIDAA